MDGRPVPHPTTVALREVVSAAVRLRHAVVRRSGLSETELVALEHLTDGPVGPSELARRLQVSAAASTGIVDRLEARGHVQRTAHSADRRRTEVHLTDSGREEVLGHLMPMLVALRALSEELDEQEHAVVQRYLRGAVAAFDRVSAPEQPATDQ
ncbi:MarR family winged helix-turn-helix transcriptional regulator [Nocardioides dongkuii]|uniref:MarR family winged helix-turn-helix transcriptional regulator n=1 Tax=Nocardioides dongkuii TaxID=2760089 RepID=UPI0015FA229A|nr:MarR family transcriptional regulator [Nocardioides dongkuii]